MTRLLLAGLAAAVAGAPATAAGPTHPQTAFINEQIAAKWKEADIKRPAARATDHEFLRRAFLDLLGRIATPEEVFDFEADSSPDKRAKLVRRLLHDRGYQPKVRGAKAPKPGGKKGEYLTFDYADEWADHWAGMWSVWLLSRTGDPRYRQQTRDWLRKGFLDGMSHKEMVTKLLTATGKTNENGAVNFVALQLGEPTPAGKKGELGPFDAVPITSRVTRLFLGLQTQCIQCHDHPFNKDWVQADFWGVNAYFRQVARTGTPTRPADGGNPRNMLGLGVVGLSDNQAQNPAGMVFYERRDGKLMASKPNFLKDLAQADRGEPADKPPAQAGGAKTRREALAHYVVTHDNFARAYVNRVWGHLFGRGLNKEAAVDDFGSHNEVVHPDLLTRLAEEFAKYDSNPRLLLEWICTSDVYGQSHVAQKEYADPKYDPYFARMPLKALSPEALFESLMTATRAEFAPNSDARENLRQQWLAKLARNFGDDEGNEGTFNGTVVQALLMMNGEELNREIGSAAGRADGANAVLKVVERHARGGAISPAAVIDELFLMTLNRHATAEEKAKLVAVQTRVTVLKPDPAKPDPKGKGSKPAPGGKSSKGGKPAPKAAKEAPGIVLPTGPADVTFYQDVFWALVNTNEFMLNH